MRPLWLCSEARFASSIPDGRRERHYGERNRILRNPRFVCRQLHSDVQFAGMKKYQVTITLQNAQVAILNPKLQVGDVAEQVTVTGAMSS